MIYDLIVLGSGPAGLAAAVGARGRNKTVLVVGNRWQESPLAKAERIDNYLGLPGLTGGEMLAAFHQHALNMGAEFVEGRVIAAMAMDGSVMVSVGPEIYQGRAMILASGVQRQAKFPGEEEFLGRGVSYCATCDGMLYRNRPVAVVGRSEEAPQEANYLRSIGCQVTYVAGKKPEELREDIPFVKASGVKIHGAETVTGVELNGEELKCDGVFVLRQAVASTDLLPQLEMENGSVKVDRHMATNVTGVWAAGDCTGAPLQVAKAVGEGHIAALAACEYLDRL